MASSMSTGAGDALEVCGAGGDRESGKSEERLGEHGDLGNGRVG